MFTLKRNSNNLFLFYPLRCYRMASLNSSRYNGNIRLCAVIYSMQCLYNLTIVSRRASTPKFQQQSELIRVIVRSEFRLKRDVADTKKKKINLQEKIKQTVVNTLNNENRGVQTESRMTRIKICRAIFARSRNDR